jgi:hypothetical protein
MVSNLIGLLTHGFPDIGVPLRPGGQVKLLAVYEFQGIIDKLVYLTAFHFKSPTGIFDGWAGLSDLSGLSDLFGLFGLFGPPPAHLVRCLIRFTLLNCTRAYCFRFNFGLKP